jgi:hypothetical protein
MAYTLKTTGIAANCTMCVAVDPDTGTIKDFASSGVTADMTVGANVTISSQAWDGNTRSYFQLGAGTASADFVAFGTTKPQWDFNSGESRTVVFIGEAAGAQVRVIGGNSGTYFASQNLSAGGATFPTFVAGSSITAAQTALSSGQKRIFGFSLVHGTSSTAYYAADTDSSMGTASLSALSPSGTTFDYAVSHVGRRNDSTQHQTDKIHAVLIFNAALSESDWDSLRDDWFTVLLESAGGGDPTLSSASFTATSDTAGDLTVTTDVAAGTLYAVLTTSATTPSDAQIAAGQDHTGAAAAWDDSDATPTAGANPFSATGLTASTEYWPHFFHDTGAGDTITGTSDTTDAAPDVTAPVLSSPVGTATGSTTATVGATTDEGNGTLYVVVTTSATAPSAAQIKAGQDHTGSAAVFDDSQVITTTGAKTFSATGLTASTAYRAHLIHTDAAANDSNIVTSAEFTTSSAANDIRLQPALDLDRGGDAASLSGLRWVAFTDTTLGTIEASGSSLTTNSSGQPTIDIDTSSFDVGDYVPLLITSFDTGTAAADRTVLTFFGFVEAIAQT